VLLIIIGRFVAVPIINLWSSPLMLEFCAGMALCRLCAFLSKKHVSSVLSKLSALLILPVMIALALYYRGIQNDFSVHFVFALGAVILILLAFFSEENLKAPAALVNVGNISYSLYLMHYYIILSLDRFLFDFTGPSVKAFVGLFLGILVSLIISWLTYSVIEKRFGLFLNKAFTKKAD
ncbi:MAG: acyltransferase family protein, partial [Lachnospiraceae bacterium]|nr:acyltransferase family protein [Lachnospiraceae bacterium]